MLKNEYKIRRMLDYKKYHLLTGDKMWALYRKYEDFDLYMSPDNKPIMTSETHSEKDLLKFAKEHYIYNFAISASLFRIFLCIINLLLGLIAFRLKNDILIGVTYGINIVVILSGIFELFISIRNYKIEMKEIKEKIKAMRDFEKNE